jgi:Flp pilus assembly protein TadD
MNQPAMAIEPLTRAATLMPASADVRYRLGVALMQSARGAEAVEPLMSAVRLAPDDPQPLSRLAWLLATHPSAKLRSGSDALFLATRANQLAREHSPQALDALAAAQAEERKFEQAADTAAKAAKLARESGDATFAEQIESRVQRYRMGRAVRDPSLAASADVGDAVP